MTCADRESDQGLNPEEVAGEEPWLQAHEFPVEPRKTILAAFDNPGLLQALGELARENAAVVRLTRPRTPDIIPFSANVKVIDRAFVGSDNWAAFCQFLEEVNQEPAPEEYTPEAEELGDLAALVDETPLVIVDREAEAPDQAFENPDAALGPVHYVSQDSVPRILELVAHILKYSYPINCPVAAQEPPEDALRLDDYWEEGEGQEE